MSDNLIEQYNEIVNEIFLYEKFIEKDFSLSINPIEIFRNADDELVWLKDIFYKRHTTWLGVGMYSEKNTPAKIESIRRRFTPEESKNPFYSIAIDNYPLNALSIHLEKKYKEVDFSKLLNIHEKWASNSLLVKVSSGIGLFSGVLANWRTIVNKVGSDGSEVIESFSSLGIVSTILYVMFMMLFLVSFVSALFLALYSKIKRSKVKRVLEYTSIRMK